MLAPGTERTPPKREKRKGENKRGRSAQPAPTGGDGSQTAAPAAAEPQAAAPAAVGQDAAAYQRRPRPPRPRGQKPGGRPDQREQHVRPPKSRVKSRSPGGPKSKPPLVPLTSEMKAGKEPLRTFGDLKQFFELKTQDENAQPEADSES
jgi:hypothetical protein